MTSCEVEKCIQQHTGKCGGCNIAEIALENSPGVYDREALTRIAEQTAAEWCPNDTSPAPLRETLKRARPSQSVW